MEQRREPRFRTDQPVTVTVLTEPRRRVNGLVRNASGRGLGVVLQGRVDPGAALQIEIEDAVVLGETIYCRADREGYFIGIELDQVLVGLTELGRNLSAFREDLPVER